jgi:hypothetical protein
MKLDDFTIGEEMKEDQECQVTRYANWTRYKCGKPVKGELKDGTPACGRHIAGEKRSIANEEKWEKERKESDEFRKQVTAIRDTYFLSTVYVGDPNKKTIVMSIDELLKVLNRE